MASDNEMLFIFNDFEQNVSNSQFWSRVQRWHERPKWNWSSLLPGPGEGWGVLRGVEWNEGASRGIEGVGGKYIFYSRLYTRQDLHQDGSQHLIFGGGRIWMTEIDPQTGKLSIIAINWKAISMLGFQIEDNWWEWDDPSYHFLAKVKLFIRLFKL